MPKKPKEQTGRDLTSPVRQIIIRKIPDDLRRAFKSRCAAEGVSQQDKIIELMREYVK